MDMTPMTRRGHTNRMQVRKQPNEARMIVAIPTTGRPNIVVETVRAIAAQDLLPDLVILSIAAPEDVLTIEPPPCSSMRGIACLHPISTLRALIAKVRSQTSTARCSTS